MYTNISIYTLIYTRIYKHKYIYELTLKIVGDSVIHVDDPEIADQIAINEYANCRLSLILLGATPQPTRSS